MAFVLLWLMGGLSGAAMTPPSAVAELLTLEMPAIVGGAAGRLVVYLVREALEARCAPAALSIGVMDA